MSLGEKYKKSTEGRIANGTVFRTTWKKFLWPHCLSKAKKYKDISNSTHLP